jgi:peptidoglycan hydrolase-like protein with peptidoglycan-binding domain
VTLPDVGSPAPSVDLRPGDQGPDVEQLQAALVALTYLTADQMKTGPGVYGPKTRAAVQTFQTEWRLTVTGIFDPATRAALERAMRGEPRPDGWDGRRPAPSTTDLRTWMPVDAPVRGTSGKRSREGYDATLQQFAVEVNPRYVPRDGNTSAHIFVSDATRALGVEIPHWVDENGRASGIGKGRELASSDLNHWLNCHGGRHGWHRVSIQDAQRLANEGGPVLASALLPDGGGDVAMVRPGELTPSGPWVCKAGPRCVARVPAFDVLPRDRTELWAHLGDRTATLGPPALPDEPGPGQVRRGDMGRDVLWLQEALVAVGHLSRHEASSGPGLFGPRTELAVKAFQSKSGLSPTGVFGPLTRGTLERATALGPPRTDAIPTVDLERGQGGRHVWELQNLLLKLGFLAWDDFVASPGELGAKVDASIRAFQVRWGLPPDGLVGDRTRHAFRQALLGAAPPEEDEATVLGAERAIAFALNPPPSEAPGPDGWRGCTVQLVREAFRLVGKSKGPLLEETAERALEAFRSAGKLAHDFRAPRGAVVFFRLGARGHMGIALGDGRYVSVGNAVGHALVRPLTVQTFAGWALP